MNEEQFYYAKLAEEALEIAHIALKIQQFGIDSNDTISNYSNRHLLTKELNDALAVVDELNDKFKLNFEPSEYHKQKKKEKINIFKNVAIQLGNVKVIRNKL